MKKFVCSICGYVYEGEELPEDFVCPLCHHGREDMKPLNAAEAVPVKPEEKPAGSGKKWVCSICG